MTAAHEIRCHTCKARLGYSGTSTALRAHAFCNEVCAQGIAWVKNQDDITVWSILHTRGGLKSPKIGKRYGTAHSQVATALHRLGVYR